MVGTGGIDCGINAVCRVNLPDELLRADANDGSCVVPSLGFKIDGRAKLIAWPCGTLRRILCDCVIRKLAQALGEGGILRIEFQRVSQ